jgi:hypothetical protein
MSLLVILEIGLGLALLYLLLSLVSTSLMELVAAVLNRRGDYLRKGLVALLGSNAAVNDFYQQALVKGLKVGERDPQYMPASLFVMALLHKLAPEGKTPADFARATPPEGWNTVSEALAPLAQTAGEEMEKFRKLVEDWFNAGMDRVSGLYKKNTQVIVLVVSVVVTTFVNANTLRIIEELYRSPEIRTKVVATSEAILQRGAPAAPPAGDGTKEFDRATAELSAYVKDLGSAEFPLGWTEDAWRDLAEKPLRSALGLLLTALLISLGAPFWFDVLSRFMVVRTTVKPGEKTRKGSAEG